jgi:hypothetical protein
VQDSEIPITRHVSCGSNGQDCYRDFLPTKGMDVDTYPPDSYAGSNNLRQLVPFLLSDLYRPSRLFMAPCYELDANPTKLNSTLILPLSSFKILSILIFIRRNIFDPIVINNNHEFLLLILDLRYYSLLLFAPPLEIALLISCKLYDIFTSFDLCTLFCHHRFDC